MGVNFWMKKNDESWRQKYNWTQLLDEFLDEYLMSTFDL